jgi:hypothetical protein
MQCEEIGQEAELPPPSSHTTYVRFRIRRFTKQAGSVGVVPAVTKDHNDQSRI